MTGIKFCGLKREEDILAANSILPEYVGFVFYKKSKRYVTADEAEGLAKKLNSCIIKVGVFVDEPISYIVDLVKRGIIDAVQLHGAETEEYIIELKSKLPDTTIIKAIIITDEKDIENANRSAADFCLADGGAGTGKAFDHSLLRGLNKRFFLAGGLTPENVNEVIKKVAPFAVDVSSGIETDGVKDIDKMKRFALNARKN